MSYKAILFDWGGVVTDDPGNSFFSDVLVSYGASEEQIKSSLQFFKPFSKGDIDERQFWGLIAGVTGLEFPDSIHGTFSQWIGIQPNEDIIKFVARLESAGYTTAILSNVIQPTFDNIQMSGGYNSFDYVIASCQVGFVKPELEIYEITLQKLGVRAEDCIFIDDQQRCLAPARTMGMHTILGTAAPQIIQDITLALGIDG